jgi:hypothetical protein
MQVQIVNTIMIDIKRLTFSQYAVYVSKKVVYIGSRNRCVAIVVAVRKTLDAVGLEYLVRIEKQEGASSTL